MTFTEPLHQFFAGFPATDATLDGQPVRAIYDGPTTVASPGSMSIMTGLPSATLPTASVPANPVGKLLVIHGVTWAVAQHDHDGTGVSTLHLERP